MLGLAAVIGFILVNALVAPLLALAHGQSVREWWGS